MPASAAVAPRVATESICSLRNPFVLRTHNKPHPRFRRAALPFTSSFLLADARIAPRSGLAYKRGIDVGAGVIDADYRGPVGVVLFNFGDAALEIRRGDRIAQLILERIVLPDVVECDELPEVGARGEAGFGSTGVSSKDADASSKKQRTISPSTSGEAPDPPESGADMETDKQ